VADRADQLGVAAEAEPPSAWRFSAALLLTVAVIAALVTLAVFWVRSLGSDDGRGYWFRAKVTSVDGQKICFVPLEDNRIPGEHCGDLSSVDTSIDGPPPSARSGACVIVNLTPKSLTLRRIGRC